MVSQRLAASQTGPAATPLSLPSSPLPPDSLLVPL